MKVVLISPPVSLKAEHEFASVQFPVNLGWIASYLIKYGYDVELWDYTVEKFSEQGFKDRLAAAKPKIVGFSCMTHNILTGAKLAEFTKEVDEDIITAVGGSHITAIPKRTLSEFPSFDIGVFGEGELTFKELCDKIKANAVIDGTRGIIHKKNGEIIMEDKRGLIENLDSVPFPSRHLVNYDLYKRSHTSRGFSRKSMNIIEIMTSRGCPNQCTFCAGHLAYGFNVRFRSAENILGEVKEAIKEHGVTHVSIEDDSFTLKKELVHELCQGFKELGLTWNCNTRVNYIDQDMLKEMADSGCQKIQFGVESGSERVLKLVKKGITPDQVRNAVKMARESGIPLIECAFIIGIHPSETWKDIKMTEKLIWELNPDFIMVSVLCPFPGTEIYAEMKERGFLKEEDWSKFILFGERPSYNTEYFTGAQLERIQKSILRRFYLRPKYIWSRISSIKNLGELHYWFGVGIDFMKSVVLGS